VSHSIVLQPEFTHPWFLAIGPRRSGDETQGAEERPPGHGGLRGGHHPGAVEAVAVGSHQGCLLLDNPYEV